MLVLAFASYILLWVDKKTRLLYKDNFISNTNIFLLMFAIVAFQFPLDFCIGNNGINYMQYFYSYDIINKSTTFNALCFVSFIIGIIKTDITKSVDFSNLAIHSNIKTIPVKYILLIMYFLWIGFIVFLNRSYINGGHGTVLINPISVACYGYFFRLNIIYLAILLYNQRTQKRKTIKQIYFEIPKLYWIIILISILLFFFANNRVYVLYLVGPVIFYVLAVGRFKTKPLQSFLIIMAVGIFFTFFKLVGIEGIFNEDNLSLDNFDNYDRFSSISPFTSELAASILSDSALFNTWNTAGVVLPGSTLVYGVLRTFSGLVPMFYSLTGLNDITYNPAVFITVLMGADYGLGSSITGDLIVSVGMVGTIVIMFFFGKLCKYGDLNIFWGSTNIKGLLIGMSIATQITFVARASLCDVISTILFCLLFFSIYKRF